MTCQKDKAKEGLEKLIRYFEDDFRHIKNSFTEEDTKPSGDTLNRPVRDTPKPASTSLPALGESLVLAGS